MSKNKPKVLDLFCGCGGLSNGFEDAGFDIKIGLDNDSSALETFKKNHKESIGLQVDLGSLNVKNFIEDNINDKINVVMGGPPCQGFSISGKRNINDPRNGFYKPFFEFVNELRPKVFLLENVPNLISMGGGKYKDQILDLFQQIGYSVKYKVLLASNYGVAQNRKRVFFVGVDHIKNDYEYPSEINNGHSEPFLTVSDAISDLPSHSLDDGSEYVSEPLSQFQRLLRANSKGIFNHQITSHSEQTRKIISLVPDGGNYKDLPEEYRDTRKVNIAWTRYSSSKPSYTIDTGHRHHFHYEYDRIPTVRENARLQSFKDDFIFCGSKTSQYRQVGNAVPPLLAKVIAESIKEQIL
ncbi:TPA: DNA cytosine methyltransferase [Legionella pneumophila]|nr:DNA cytosine methyltransferase [Legionella pneumophila]